MYKISTTEISIAIFILEKIDFKKNFIKNKKI